MSANLPAIAGLICALFAQIANSTEVLSHCNKEEVTYFSCQIQDSSKVVSLCGPGLRDRDGNVSANMWLQYRFGTPHKLEFVFPSTRRNSLTQFRGTFHAGQSASVVKVTFINKGVTYTTGTAFSALTGEGFDGVTISLPSKKTVRLACATTPKIRPGLYDLVQNVLESDG